MQTMHTMSKTPYSGDGPPRNPRNKPRPPIVFNRQGNDECPACSAGHSQSDLAISGWLLQPLLPVPPRGIQSRLAVPQRMTG